MNYKRFLLTALCIFVSLLIGCAGSTTHRATSVVDYLYPNQSDRIEKPSIPTLSLPMNVGIAFVPSATDVSFNERQKMELMEKVSGHFKKYPFVKTIELIPSAYLRPQGSFTNLDQIRTMFSVDVIALLSYDQTQFTDEGVLSLAYWTLIGAYIVPGEKNDTHTMMDAAVYDISSRKLLFRAPGISQVEHRATPVNLKEQLRLDSQEGIREASKELVKNLEVQLEQFKEKVKHSPQQFKVVHKPGYTGAGNIDGIMAILITALGVTSLWMRRIWKI
ncbi:MAG: rhombotarget lipoprotein [Nitrospirales bacterium]|nr:rhombotarget lipoprotein [Nitrospirales bacterium]